jgi:large subunit ribosomal protein L15
MQRRLPKRGFRVPFAAKVIAINVGELEQRFDAKDEVNEAALRDVRLVQGKLDRIKILGEGELSKALTVTAHGFSETARLKIEAAGGRVVLVPVRGESADSPAADSPAGP